MVQPVVFQPFLSTQAFSMVGLLGCSQSWGLIHSDHQPPSDHLPCSSGDLDPRDSYHSGLLGSGSSLTLAVGFFQGIPKG